MSNVVPVGDRLIDTGRPEPTRYQHVVKHLYAWRQRWDLAIPEMPHNPRLQARRSGCQDADLSPGGTWDHACDPCRAHILTDDLRWYRPASLDAIRSSLAAGHHAVVDTAQGRREMLVGHNGVIVILGRPSRGGEQRLLTAYRDPPSVRAPTQEQFHAKAVRKLRDKASLGSGGPS